MPNQSLRAALAARWLRLKTALRARQPQYRWSPGVRLDGEAFESLMRLVAVGSNRSWRDRSDAMLLLGSAALSSEQRDRAISALILAASNTAVPTDVGGRTVRWLGRTLLAGAVISVVPSLGGMPLPVMTALEWFLRGLGTGAVIAAIPMALVSWLIETGRIDAVRRSAVEALGHLRDFRALDAVAWAAHDRNNTVREQAHSSLQLILPEVPHHSCGLVPVGTVWNLCACLNDGECALSLAILDALEKCAGGSAVTPVARTAVNSRHERVRLAATRALAKLRDRQRREQQSALLLRPSDQPEVADTLLRAARASSSDEDRLPRPARIGQ